MFLIGALILSSAVVATVAVSACSAMGRPPKGERLEKIQSTEYYRDGRFQNEVETEVMLSGSFRRTFGEWFNGDQVREPETPPAIVKLTSGSFVRPPESGFRITWLGHNTVLIEIDGLRILTDPVFGQRPSPLSWAGPKRFHPVPLTVEDLPEIDAVVISHDHYDHLDKGSIQALGPKTRAFYLPLGVGSHLESWGIPPEKIVEAAWWEERRLEGGTILAATPARHFSGRGMTDRNKTHWASWVLIGSRWRVFFGGDTGLTPSFEEVGRRYGPFDATLMPIGSYGPTWPTIHLTPEEAVVAHRQVRGGVLLPIHWGTFNLAFHGWTEPVERLMAAASRAGVQVATPRPGESVEPGREMTTSRWWPEIPWEKPADSPTPTLAEAQ